MEVAEEGGKWAHPVGGGNGHREGRRKRSQALPEEEAVPGFSPGVAPGIKGATGQPPPGQPPGTHSEPGAQSPAPAVMVRRSSPRTPTCMGPPGPEGLVVH